MKSTLPRPIWTYYRQALSLFKVEGDVFERIKAFPVVTAQPVRHTVSQKHPPRVPVEGFRNARKVNHAHGITGNRKMTASAAGK
jgi:hypothetical protein